MKKRLLLCLLALCVMMIGNALAADRSIEEAAEINVNTSCTGYIGENNESDYYKFVLPNSGYVTVSFSHGYVDSSNTYWNLQLLNYSQQEYLHSSYVGNVTQEVRSYAVGLPAGTYYVRVTDDYANYHNRHSSEPYEFSVNYTESEVWEKEFNNSIPNANEIMINTSYSGSVKDSGDMDFYKFTLERDGYVTVSFSHGYVDSGNTYWRLWILSSTQSEYLYQTYNGNITEERQSYAVGLPAGTYYIKVDDDYENYHNRHSSQTYHFSVNYTETDFWEKEFNNTIPDATPISINTSYSGAVKDTGDMDFYQFVLEGDGYITISFSHGYVDSGSDYWRMWVLNSSSNEYLYQTYTGNGGDAVSCKLGLAAGTYYIKIDDDYENYHNRHSSQTYSFSVNYTKTSSWETEFNNSITSADLITVGSEYSGVIRNNDDEDYYSFQLKAKSNVFVRFDHDLLDTTETRWDLRLIDSTQKEYIGIRIAGNEKQTYTSMVELDAGTYYIHVRKSTQYYGGRSNSTPYTFIVCSDLVTESGLNYLLSGSEATFIGPANKKITKITIPNVINVYGNSYKVVKIDDGSCKGLTKLQSVSVGKNVSIIGKKAFMNCTVLRTVSGCAGVTLIDNSAFQGCKALGKYNLGTKTKEIGNSAFSGCKKLSAVSGGKALIKIGTSAFLKCSSLKQFVFNAKVESIGKDAFNGCSSLKDIEIKTRKLKESTVGANAFKGIYKKAVIKCPKGKLDAYRKILRKRGVSKSAVFK